MVDNVSSVVEPGSNPPPPSKTGLGQVGTAIISAVIARHAMSYLETNYSVDFTAAGLSADVVKDAIIGTVVGIPTWLTPSNFVIWVKDTIIFFKGAIKQWRDAAKSE